MAANPITYSEIEAFCRLRFIRLPVWELNLLRRLDEAVLAVWAAQAPKPGGNKEPIPITDTAGVKALLLSKATKQTP